MKKLRVTVNGTAYDVDVEILEDSDDDRGYGFPKARDYPAPPHSRGPSQARAEVSQPVQRPPSTNKKELTSPIAGMVTEVKVKAGDVVAVNDLLMVIEAMKMNTHISSPVAGTIARVDVTAKEGVTQGQVLLIFA